MSYNLVSNHGDFVFNTTSWGNLLDLASMYGWEPAGTEAPIWGELTDPHYIQLRDEWNAAWKTALARGDEPPPAPEIPHSAYTWDSPNLHWDGAYDWNDGQGVTDADARNLADALARALDDIPDHDAMDHKTEPIDGMPGLRAITDVDFSPIEFWSGRYKKERLREFIAFCQKGGFGIH